MNQKDHETQNLFSGEDNDDCPKDSEGIHLDSSGESSSEIEGESGPANQVDIVLDEGEPSAVNQLDTVDNVAVPKIGMVFSTVEEGYNYYNKYARMVGFSIKKRRTHNSKSKPSVVMQQLLCCSCEGFYNMGRPPKRKRKETRCGCQAMFKISLIDYNNYKLTKFVEEHNHELVPSDKTHMLRSHRKLKPPPVKVNKMQTPTLQQSDIYSHVFAEGNKAQSRSSAHSDFSNPVQNSCDVFIKMSDGQFLLDYFNKKKRENKHFVYTFQTNEDCKICGIFFSDAKSRRDYGLFGDAVCFDTTSRTKDNNMVCVLTFGVNNHGHTILFGCGILNGETVDAYVWLFATFLETMGGKKPNTIFSKQSTAIMKVVSDILPETHHKSYPWYIYFDATMQLAQVCVEFKTLAQRFQECIYDSETIEEFENLWELLLEEYRLKDNDWLQGLYDSRQSWAHVYGQGHLCAGMTTSQKIESTIKFLRTFFGSSLTLQEFVNQYAKAMANRHEKEKEAENVAEQKLPIFYSNWSIEREAAKQYTNKMFCLFQEEYKCTLDQKLKLERDDGAIHVYKVTEMEGRRRNHILTYNQPEQSILCSCRKFEFHGVLCSHALKLFRELEFTTLPSKYYLKRWTKGATDEIVFDSYGEAIHGDIDPMTLIRYDKLSRISQRLTAKAVKSNAVYSLAKIGMLELEARMDAFSKSEEEQRNYQKKVHDTRGRSVSNSDEDAPLENTKMKRCEEGQSAVENHTPNKSTPAKQLGSLEEGAAIPQLTGGTLSIHQTTQVLNGLAHCPSQVPPWYSPYNFMGCPDQRYRPILPRINKSQQAPSAQTQEPQQRALK